MPPRFPRVRPPRFRPRLDPPSRPEVVIRGIRLMQEAIYIAVGLLLATAGVLVVAGTVDALVDSLSGAGDSIGTGVQVLDRVLLLLIVAELLFTLRLVLYEGEIFAEPFLLIGLIAVVRRVVVVTAEGEELSRAGRELTNLLLELGVLAALALAFGGAIFLLRRGATAQHAVLAEQGEPFGESAGGTTEDEQ